MSWPWIVLLALGVAVVIGAEWPHLARAAGADARQQRRRAKRKASLKVITTPQPLQSDPDSDEFARSVQRDLDALPTTDEPRVP